jgi:hypothetical protein
MPAGEEPARDRKLLAAGLVSIGSVQSVGGIDSSQAWLLIVRGDVTPTVVVDDDREDNLEEIDRQWWRLAEAHRIVGEDGSFLVSVSGEGASLPWAVVRGTRDARLAATLTTYPDEPEFVTMARDGHAVLGVTSEEDCTWLVYVDLVNEPRA